MTRDAVIDTVARVLTPYIGAHMARAAVMAQVQKVRLADPPTADEIEKLIDLLGLGLNVFIGRDKCKGVVAEMRLAVGER